MNGLFEIFFGLCFGGVGFMVMAICIIKPEGTVVENAWIGILVGGLFGLIGLGIIYSGIKQKLKTMKAKAEGAHYNAKIISHEPDYSIRVNGRPAIALVLRFKDGQGRLRQEVVKTGSTDWKKFQAGGAIEIAEYEGEIYVIGKRSEMVNLPGQEELMDPYAQVVSLTGFGSNSMMTQSSSAPAIGTDAMAGPAVAAQPMGMAGAMSVACPGCGAVSMVLPGTTIVCKCGRQFKLTEDHMIV